jgi:hypothetical protein
MLYKYWDMQVLVRYIEIFLTSRFNTEFPSSLHVTLNS